MPPVDPTQDPDFMKAAPHDQLAYLSQTDPDFAKANPQDQLAYLMHIRGLSSNLAPPTGSVPQPMPMQKSNLGIALGSGNTSRSAIANPQQPAEQFALEHPEQQGTLATSAGIGAAGAAGVATSPVVLPAVKAMAAAHPVIATMLASEAISQARNIPYVGKLIPPYSEMIPMLLGGGKPAEGTPTEGAPPAPETIWDKPPAPVSRPAPAWKTQQQLPEGFNPTLGTKPQANPWLGSTPEEIQAQLQRMANRPKTTRTEGQPVESMQVQTLPVKAITQPPMPGPQTYDVVRGTDPFTHSQAPPRWEATHDYSSNVDQYGYHPDSNTISVKYNKGAVYQFKGTQQMYNNMKQAPSVGGYIHDVLEPAQTTGKGTYIGTIRPKSTPGQKVSQALGGQQ